MRFKLLVLSSFLAILITSVADARPFRPGMIPNGFPAAGGCLACHTGFPRPGNSPSNVFDLEVEARIAPDGEEAFWNQAQHLSDIPHWYPPDPVPPRACLPCPRVWLF